MQKEKEDRYESAKVDDIERFMSGALVQVYEYSWRERVTRTYKAHKTIFNTILISVLTIVSIVLISYLNIRIVRDDAVIAWEQEKVALEKLQLDNYISDIRLAQAYILQKDYMKARDILWSIDSEHKHWEWGHLLNLCYQSRYTIPNDSMAAVHSETQRIATATSLRPLTSRVLSTGEVEFEVPDSDSRIVAIEYSSDGGYILAPTVMGLAIVWNATNGEIVAEFKVEDVGIYSAHFDSSGTEVITAGMDNVIRVWSLSAPESPTVGPIDASW